MEVEEMNNGWKKKRNKRVMNALRLMGNLFFS